MFGQTVQQQFDILCTTTDGKIFANDRVDVIRRNPEMPTVGYLKSFLNSNPSITPETCATGLPTSEKLESVIQQLKDMAS